MKLSQVKVGDLVVGNELTNKYTYSVTRQGTEWVIYEVGAIPDESHIRADIWVGPPNSTLFLDFLEYPEKYQRPSTRYPRHIFPVMSEAFDYLHIFESAIDTNRSATFLLKK